MDHDRKRGLSLPVAAPRMGLMTLRVLVLALFTSHSVILSDACAQSAGDHAVEERYNLISAFLYNFLLFTEWPDDDPESPLVIGVVGENPFGKAADAIAQKTVAGRTIQFRYFSSPDAVTPTHILFVPRNLDHESRDICRRLRGRPVLTVGEGEAFTREGGVIRFFEQLSSSGAEAVLRVEINETIADEAGLKFRSKLMRLAQLVRYPWPKVP